ncbi:cytochrome P450 [Phytohabitans houttuyneae]|uniref:Cytochrome P450 n=2 Tax=Phytohabitans houttuyneae TaxID=1076126 RepID=A0A6V8KCB6_9ACTN|nr:cytochrome P450 [Phytohabitans houttuyneae]
MLDEAQQVLDWPFPRPSNGHVPHILAELREAPPCVIRIPAGAVPSRRAWLVTRYPDVTQALKDPRLSVDETLPGAPVRIQLPPGEKPSSFLRADDPEHDRLRGMVVSEFTARRVRTMGPAIERLINELLDDFESKPRPADLQDAFTRQLPTLVIARLVGVPDEESPFFVESTRVSISQGNPQRSYAAFMTMSERLRELAAERAADPKDDVMSRLAVNYMAKGELTMDELVALVRLLLIAGHETTTNQIALNVLSMLLDDELRDAVMANDGALIPQFVEEALRFWSISQDGILRMALEDMELGGVQMKKGDAVVISIPSANHDESKFPDPGHIDVHRDTHGHMQWGNGPHYCTGAPLARLEMQLAVKILFQRFPTLKLAIDKPDGLFRRETVFHGVYELPVTW